MPMVSHPQASNLDGKNALDAARALTAAIQSTAEWQELVSTNQALEGDRAFRDMLRRCDELEQAQEAARDNGQNFAGKELVELISLRSRIQAHELSVRQQDASRAVAQLLKQVNRAISEGFGFDFAHSVTPRRDRCCG